MPPESAIQSIVLLFWSEPVLAMNPCDRKWRRCWQRMRGWRTSWKGLRWKQWRPFGCVLYELLTGKQAFEGESVTETLAAVLKEDPDWTLLPAITPASIRVLLRRCLQKELTRRLRDVTDVRIEIEDALSAPASAEPRTAIIAARPVWRRAIPWAAGLLGGALVAGLAVWNLKPAPPKPVARTVVTLPPDDRLGGGPRPVLALSRDGTRLPYAASRGGSQQIYLRAIDSLEARPVSGTEGATSPFFSPDGFAQ